MDYEIIKSKRKTVSVEVKNDGRVIVRAPQRMPKYLIDAFVREHEDWIETHLRRIEEQNEKLDAEDILPLTEQELKNLTLTAKRVIPERVAHFAPLVGVDYERITIRHQKTRWGSCSREGNLNFNCLLMLTPPQVLDYVVVHELCHRLEMNHSRAFYAQVARVYPEYRMWQKWLKQNGGSILRRLPKEDL